MLARRRIEKLRGLDSEIKQVEQDLRERVRGSSSGLLAVAGIGDLIAAGSSARSATSSESQARRASHA
jgi:hypothetical protein